MTSQPLLAFEEAGVRIIFFAMSGNDSGRCVRISLDSDKRKLERSIKRHTKGKILRTVFI
jgi:hypothetical protein